MKFALDYPLRDAYRAKAYSWKRPLICFPIIYVFLNAGASIPALMSFVTAGSVFAVHRVVAFELPLLGARFVKIRFLSCLLLPPLAGLAAAFIEKVFQIEI